MKTIHDLIGEHAFFQGLSDDALELIAGCGQNVRFREDEYILTEGEPADTLYVIRAGRVAIEISTPRRGPRVIETVAPDEILGVSWMLPPYRWTFDARAIEPVRAVVFDAACLRSKCDDDPVLGYELFKRFAGLVRDRLQAARLQLLDVYDNGAG